MGTEDGSMLDLVENERIDTETQEFSSEPPQSSSTSYNENARLSRNENASKTILNDAFELDLGADDVKKLSDIDVTQSNSLDNLESSRSPELSDSRDVELADNNIERPKRVHVEEEQNENKLKPPDLQTEIQKSGSSGSIIIDEKDTVEIYFKSYDASDDDLEHAAELDISSAVIVQPSSTVSIKTQNDVKESDSKKITAADQNDKAEGSDVNYLHHDTDLDLYPLSSDEHRNCCYRCWYSEQCNACIIGLIDRIPDRCLCPCLLSCYSYMDKQSVISKEPTDEGGCTVRQKNNRTIDGDESTDTGIRHGESKDHTDADKQYCCFDAYCKLCDTCFDRCCEGCLSIMCCNRGSSGQK